MPARPMIFVDLETTGARAGCDRITEIGLVEVAADGVVSEWSSLVNPETPIPPFIERLTGISDAMVADAPRFGEIAAGVLARLEGRLFVAHNARFDYGFLRHEFKRAGLDFRADVLCSVKLSRKLFPQHHKHNLGALIERHQLAVDARHRALADARAIHAFWRMIHAELPGAAIQAALDGLLSTPALPAGLDAALLDDLPESHGAYVLHGEADEPLYVGRGGNIRRAVLNHFLAAPGLDARLTAETRRVTWEAAAGELGARLAEARLLSSLRPRHNRARREEDACAWKMARDAAGEMTLTLVRGVDGGFGDGSGVHGLFPSRRKAEDALREMARVHRLCLVRLGLEAARPCSGHCAGWCLGREGAGPHDFRLMNALAGLKTQAWPFHGAVGIRETAWDGWTQIHVLDRWCHLGTVESEAALVEWRGWDPVFDAGVHGLLRRYLRRGGLDLILLGV